MALLSADEVQFYHQNGYLLAISDRLKGCPDSHLSFTKANITANQPVHWN